ncbi:VRR-NUC domain-containing protein [Fundicoccus ignavus]|nr:VRR-NUC domain-containing protein [Fundicoccus ignavus]
MQKMSEHKIEAQLVKTVKAQGGLCLKLNSTSMIGLPDRLILLSGGKFAFVEVKSPGEKLRPIQVKRMNDLQQLGFRYYVLDNLEQIDTIIEEVTASEI